MIFTVKLHVRADDHDHLRDVLAHLIEWTNGRAVVEEIRRKADE